jgi:hypothetical protein
MKKVIAISSVLFGVVFLAGCGQQPTSQVLDKKSESVVKNNLCEQATALKKKLNEKFVADNIDYIHITRYEVKRKWAMMAMAQSQDESCAISLVELNTVNLLSDENDSSSLKEEKNKKLSEYIGEERATKIVNAAYTNDINDKIIESKVQFLWPDASLCVDEDGYLLEPKTGLLVCQSSTAKETWLNLEIDGGKWGGCEFFVNRNGNEVTFQYCATTSSGKILTCNENGCHNEDGKNF